MYNLHKLESPLSRVDPLSMMFVSEEYRDILEKSQSVLTRLALSIFSTPNLRLSLEDITGNHGLVSEENNNITLVN